jgi:hypothetical protein
VGNGIGAHVLVLWLYAVAGTVVTVLTTRWRRPFPRASA